jgi:hypothetical protein
MPMRLGVVIDDESLLRAAKAHDPVDVVVLRSTFLNPPRAAAARRIAERIRTLHPNAELIPYAWHYLTHEPGDGIVVGSNRSLEGAGSYGHLRGDARAQVWSIIEIYAEAMSASRVVIRTPPSFSPGSLSRRRFKSFVESIGPEGLELLWEPQGLWETAQAAVFAAEFGVEVIAPVFSMTGALLDFEGANWLRIGGSKDARLQSSHAEILADALAELDLDDDLDDDDEQLTLLFDGPRAYANLRSFERARSG